jgi:phospholipid/cholesterol/gamma-HCH transport system substrate-binding protein
MEEGFTRREKLVGFFLLAMIIVTMVTLLVIAQGKGWFQPQKTFLIKFKQGYNLRQGSLVKMFNTEIGKVTAMRVSRVMDENQVEITIKVLAEYGDLIRQDSIAEVVSPTLIGSEYVEISPGSSGYPPIQDYGTIPSQARKSMTDSIAEFFNEERIQQFQTILTNFTQFSEQLKNHEKVWLSTVKHVDEIMVALLEAKGTMGQLLMKQDFLNRLDASLAQMDRVLKEAQNIAGDLRPAAKAVAQEIDTLKGILADIKEGTQEFPGLMESAGEATQGGKEVVDAVKANPLIRMTLPKDKPSQPLKVEPRHVP